MIIFQDILPHDANRSNFPRARFLYALQGYLQSRIAHNTLEDNMTIKIIPHETEVSEAVR